MNLAEVWGHLEEDTRITEASGRVQRRIEPAGRRKLLPWLGDACEESNADTACFWEFS